MTETPWSWKAAAAAAVAGVQRLLGPSRHYNQYLARSVRRCAAARQPVAAADRQHRSELLPLQHGDERQLLLRHSFLRSSCRCWGCRRHSSTCPRLERQGNPHWRNMCDAHRRCAQQGGLCTAQWAHPAAVQQLQFFVPHSWASRQPGLRFERARPSLSLLRTLLVLLGFAA